MKRREFITLLGGATAAGPLAAGAQQPDHRRRIGVLMGYAETDRRGAAYADRILKGAKPSELPVQAPLKFELVINLRTAKPISLEVPVHLQQLADEVIE